MIYALSLSTVVKEVNSSFPRIQDAFVDELVAEICPPNDENCIGNDAGELVKDILSIRPNMGQLQHTISNYYRHNRK